MVFKDIMQNSSILEENSSNSWNITPNLKIKKY